MRRSRFLLNTVKETPKEAVVISHILMLRTGMIKQLTSGVYSYMPLALRTIRKIENIVREELNAAGCQELLMPMVQPAELWIESKRWLHYGKELLRFKDRKNNDFCLGPTHEEVITDIVRREVRSYKDLPLNLYQVQTKFRDEIRPRFGLMRGREFIMKDGYSFDMDDPNADQAYWSMYEAYKRIFTRCGLDFRPVEADAGSIGGTFTHEFHVLAESGEDEILSCNACDYAANVERCEVRRPEPAKRSEAAAPVKVATPGQKTIEAVCNFLNLPKDSSIKMTIYRCDEQVVGAAVVGSHEVNEIALKNATGAIEVGLETGEAFFQKYGLSPGYIGPQDWPKEVPLFVDHAVMALESGVAGANELDHHVTGLVPVLHVKPSKVLNLRRAHAGDACPRCESGVMASFRGIEVGHVFKLGTKYSEAMNATFLDTEGKAQLMVMGCYGIGITRTMASAIEQNHDANGIIWPIQIAPFQLLLINLDPKDETVSNAADGFYKTFTEQGVEVLYDDTPERPGFKFKDADLIGIPLQFVVGGRSLKEGVVEVKNRRTGEKKTLAVAEAVEGLLAELRHMGWTR